MMQIIAWIAICLAVGGIITTILLELAYISIRISKVSLSEYYYDVSRRPSSPTHIDAFSKVLLGILIFSLLFIFYLTVLLILLNFNETEHGQVLLSKIEFSIDSMQVGLNILVPTLISIIVLFGESKKPRYVLFASHNPIKQLYPWLCSTIIVWTVCLGLLVLGKISQKSSLFWFFLYSASILMLPTCLILGVVTLIKICHYVFAPSTLEEKLLNTLYSEFCIFGNFLPHINSENALPIDSNNYLIDQLVEKSKKAKRKLKEYISQTSVEFWNAIDKSTKISKTQVLFPICFLIALSFIMGFEIIIFLSQPQSIEEIFIDPGNQYLLFAFFLSAIVFCLLVILFIDYSPFFQMRRAVIYGRWGYLFFDEAGTPRRYIPRYPLYGGKYDGKVGQWFHALLNVLTLCRIECVNNCTDDLLKKLRDTLSEFSARTNGEAEAFTFALTYCLCLKLAQEQAPTVEYQSELEQVLHETSHKQLLISWADAIWIDMKRDMDWYREKYGSPEPVAAATPGT